MPPAPAFIDVLEEKLGEVLWSSTPAVDTSTYRPVAVMPPVLGFFSFTAGVAPVVAPGRLPRVVPDTASDTVPEPIHRGSTAANPPTAVPLIEVTPKPARRRRTLSARDQQAFDALIDLGAALDVDFTADDLRRQFRQLARRYHPDRHPDSTQAVRVRLADAFARVRAAYERLRPLTSS